MAMKGPGRGISWEAVWMGASDLFLAGARFPLDQHRRRRLGDMADELEDLEHARVLAQDIAERVRLVDLLLQGIDLVESRVRARAAPLHDQTGRCSGSGGLVRKS